MNRMFQVIVVGGMSLTGYACGSNVVAANAGATSGGGGFPQETAGPTTVATTGGFGGFPQETASCAPGCGGFPTISGAGGASGFGGATGLGGFPTEGPDASPPYDGGGFADAASDADSGFPQEAPPAPP